jgi:hypothetical protein
MNNGIIKKILKVVEYIGSISAWFARSLRTFPVFSEQKESGTDDGTSK